VIFEDGNGCSMMSRGVDGRDGGGVGQWRGEWLRSALIATKARARNSPFRHSACRFGHVAELLEEEILEDISTPEMEILELGSSSL